MKSWCKSGWAAGGVDFKAVWVRSAYILWSKSRPDLKTKQSHVQTFLTLKIELSALIRLPIHALLGRILVDPIQAFP